MRGGQGWRRSQGNDPARLYGQNPSCCPHRGAEWRAVLIRHWHSPTVGSRRRHGDPSCLLATAPLWQSALNERCFTAGNWRGQDLMAVSHSDATAMGRGMLNTAEAVVGTL